MIKEPIRAEVFYTGHVQGVGFRYTCVTIAAGYQVTGFVRNLPDGRVQLVIEGLPEQVDGLLEAVQTLLGETISTQTRENRPITGEFRSFEITR